MRLSAPHLLWSLAAVLAAGVLAEAFPNAERAPVSTTVAPPGFAHVVAASTEPVADWIATVLSRPLFTTDRRPVAPAAAAAATTGPQALPRLAGIVVSPSGRSAIFAGNLDQSPEHSAVVVEGAAIGLWRVVAIRSDAVDISGPQGERTVKPSYSDDPPPAAAVAASLPFNGHPGFATFNPQNAALASIRAPSSPPAAFGTIAAPLQNRP